MEKRKKSVYLSEIEFSWLKPAKTSKTRLKKLLLLLLVVDCLQHAAAFLMNAFVWVQSMREILGGQADKLSDASNLRISTNNNKLIY